MGKLGLNLLERMVVWLLLLLLIVICWTGVRHIIECGINVNIIGPVAIPEETFNE